MAIHERPKSEFTGLDIDLAIFKNKLIRDIAEMISKCNIFEVDYSGDINLYGSTGSGAVNSFNIGMIEVSGDITPIQKNIVKLYSFMISSQIVNALPDSKYEKLINLFNTDRGQYDIASKSIIKYIGDSCKMYCNVWNIKSQLYNTIDNKIKHILSEIYN